ncbi:glycoside hydrolase family 3 protein [Pelagibacteraceae bacterium]|jgi:beta-N-acetylhexosaminidase|nr:glycoside hydrolase family 3 protein [Pelagibacteraceae bacterium]
MKKKAIIISIKSYKLTKKEEKIFANENPWGLIIFKRNIKSFNQIKKLISKIRKLTNDDKFPIMIDEEGHTVTRLSKIINNDLSQKLIGDIYKSNPIIGLAIYKDYIKNLCIILNDIGININTVPVLDVLRKNTSKIIGTRSFSNNPYTVKKLGIACINQYDFNKIATVIKHIPGHGCASTDSHLKLPKVKLNFKDLNKIDFEPFKSSSAKFAMTAHILYTKIDNLNVATFSKKIIKGIIRKKMKFNGILISDDISMKALKFDLITNAKKALSSGCNLVLYCAGHYSESCKLIKELPYIDKYTEKKTSQFYKFLR